MQRLRVVGRDGPENPCDGHPERHQPAAPHVQQPVRVSGAWSRRPRRVQKPDDKLHRTGTLLAAVAAHRRHTDFQQRSVLSACNRCVS